MRRIGPRQYILKKKYNPRRCNKDYLKIVTDLGKICTMDEIMMQHQQSELRNGYAARHYS